MSDKDYESAEEDMRAAVKTALSKIQDMQKYYYCTELTVQGKIPTQTVPAKKRSSKKEVNTLNNPRKKY